MSLSSVTSIIDGLKRLYLKKLKPLEATYRFNDFVSPALVSIYVLFLRFFSKQPPFILFSVLCSVSDTHDKCRMAFSRLYYTKELSMDLDSLCLQTNSDFDAKPMVMLLGQYSTGKTTFIKHLLRTSYPGK